MRAFRCYRWVHRNPDGSYRSENGGVTWRLGEWVKHDGPLELCHSGLHGCRDAFDALDYSGYGDVFMVAEYRGKTSRRRPGGDTKFCVGEMRLLWEVPEGVIRRAALGFAEHVYLLWEKEYPDDSRVRASLDATRAYLDDPTPENEAKMHEAAGAAGAAWAAWVAEAVWAAGAARVAEKKWQRDHLKQLIEEATQP